MGIYNIQYLHHNIHKRIFYSCPSVSGAFSSVFVCQLCIACARNETTGSVCSSDGGVLWGPGGPLLDSESAGLAGDLNFV